MVLKGETEREREIQSFRESEGEGGGVCNEFRKKHRSCDV